MESPSKKNAPSQADTSASGFYLSPDAAQLREHESELRDELEGLEHDSEITEHSFETAQQLAEIDDDWRPCPRSCFRETKLAKWWRLQRKAAR
jgi:hypothetical protein